MKKRIIKKKQELPKALENKSFRGAEKHGFSRESRLIENRDIAYDFSVKAYKIFKEIVKSIVLFGSVPKKEININSDVDIVIIIDDATIKWDDELIAWYREELSKLVSSQKYVKHLHINTVTMSTFWQEVNTGEPVTINVLRYGEALIDYGGFFEPLKALLAKGRIRPTPEAIFITMERANAHVFQGNNNLLASIEAYYWAMVDSSHSALMAVNVIPPSPEFISEMLLETFVKARKLDKKYVDWFEETRKLAKQITYGEVRSLSGDKIEEIKKKTEQFVRVLTDITKVLIQNQKIIRTEYKKII